MHAEIHNKSQQPLCECSAWEPTQGTDVILPLPPLERVTELALFCQPRGRYG